MQKDADLVELEVFRIDSSISAVSTPTRVVVRCVFEDVFRKPHQQEAGPDHG